MEIKCKKCGQTVVVEEYVVEQFNKTYYYFRHECPISNLNYEIDGSGEIEINEDADKTIEIRYNNGYKTAKIYKKGSFYYIFYDTAERHTALHVLYQTCSEKILNAFLELCYKDMKEHDNDLSNFETNYYLLFDIDRTKERIIVLHREGWCDLL